MLIYVDEMLQEIDEIAEVAKLLQAKFEAGRDASELLLDAKTLQRRIQNLATMLPDKSMVGTARRHCNFMVLFLEKNQIDRCVDDIHAIVDDDIQETVRLLKEWANKLHYVDADLRTEIAPLIRTRQFDSAIRKVFVILKTRLCNKFGVSDEIDGAPLVNAIFGKDSPHLTHLSPGLKQTYRDLFAGLFGLLRNKFAHNSKDPDLADLDAAIANVNLCLRVIDDFREKPTDDLF
jgi:Protein of unknown function (Hypoth_ymh)